MAVSYYVIFLVLVSSGSLGGFSWSNKIDELYDAAIDVVAPSSEKSDLPPSPAEPVERAPVRVQWVNPAHKQTNSHMRVKRSNVGEGVPTVYQLSLEALSPHDSTNAEFKVGSVVSYRCTLSVSELSKTVALEFYTEHNGGAYFMLSNVRIGQVGSNLDSFTAEDKEVLYYSIYDDGRFDRATLDLGLLVNDLENTVDAAASEIEVLFNAQALVHESLVHGEKYRVSVAGAVDDYNVIVAQHDLVYNSEVTDVDTTSLDSYTLSGPSTLSRGLTDLWTITATVFELTCDFSLDVYAPIDVTGFVSIDALSVKSVGENYKHGINNNTYNVTITGSETQGDYARLDLGTIINSGYHDQDHSDINNMITFEVAMTVHNDALIDAEHDITFVAWKSRSGDDFELSWKEETALKATNETFPEMITSADFTVSASAETVAAGSLFGILVNLSIPVDTIAEYQVEVSVPTHDGLSVMNIERVRVSNMGFNFPHLEKMTEYHLRNVSMDGTNVNHMFVSFDKIRNTGQRHDAENLIVQVEVAVNMLDTANTYYSDGQVVPVTVGVSHNLRVYWVAIMEVTLSHSSLLYSSNQAPKPSMLNVMGREYVMSAETAAIVDLDIVIPPSVSYTSLFVEFDTSNSSGHVDEETTLKLLEVQTVHVGKALMFRDFEKRYYGRGEVETNGEPVYHLSNFTLELMSNLKMEESPRYEYEDSTLRLRVITVCRGNTSHLLNDGDVQWITATVAAGDEYIYAGSVGIQYSESTVDYYTGFDWQPGFDVTMAKGYMTHEVGRGAVLRYNIAVNVPYKTSAELNLRIESTTAPIQVCQVFHNGFGSAMVDYLPPKTTDAEILYDNSTDRLVESFLNIPALTSYSYDYYTDFVHDAYTNFTAVVMLEESAVTNETYNFLTEITLGHLEPVHFQSGIMATDVLSTLDVPPVFNMTHHMATDTINVGGSEIIYIDMYIPPATSHRYHVRVHAPWNDTFYGEYKILHAFMVSSGHDLACFNGYTTNVTIPLSNGTDNEAVFYTSYIANIADGSQGFTPSKDNNVRLAVHVALKANTTIPVGEKIPVTVTIDMNHHQDIWLGVLDLEVIDPEDQRNVNPPSNITLHVTAYDDRVFSIGERQYFHTLIRVPPGMAVTQFKVVVESPMVGDETLLTVSEPNLTRHGSNLLETLDYRHLSNDTDFLQTYSRTVDFGFVRNLDIDGQSHFIGSTPDEDEIEFEFSVRLMDHVTLSDNHEFVFNVTVFYLDDVVVHSTGDTLIQVSAPPTDKTDLFWDVYIIDNPENITSNVFDSIVSFGLDIGVTNKSTRFPDDITVFYRVPFISSLVPDSLTFIGLDHEFQATTEVNQFGLQFQFNRLRFDYEAYINFSVVVDPDSYIEFGLLDRHMDVPVDIRFHESQKNSTADPVEFFTEVRVLEFELYIPECLDSLGAASAGSMLDCQFSASVEDGSHTAQEGRLGSSGAWATLDRGPPFYQHEYIQVDFGGQVRISAVTIQPADDVNVTRVTSFKLQYSREGTRWDYLLEYGVEKELPVDWQEPVTADSQVTVPLDHLAFHTRFVRILPQTGSESSYAHKMRFDLHGCPWPYKSVLPAYQCPTIPTLKSYDERQMLAVNDTVLVCIISEPNSLPYCSGSNDFGSSWFAVDDIVMNVLGYEPSQDAFYALARNRKNSLRSIDRGHTWTVIEEHDFTAMSSLSEYTTAKALPFPLNYNNVSALFAAYGFENPGISWSVSEKGVHAYPTDQLHSKTTADDRVGRWGTTDWE